MLVQGLIKSLILGILLQYHNLMICDKVVHTIQPSEDFSCSASQCLTFKQFTANVSRYLRAETILQISPGNHSLHSLTISNIQQFSLISQDTSSNIICSQFEGIQFNQVDKVTFINLTFIECGKNPGPIAVLKVTQVNIDISMCVFSKSQGRVIHAVQSCITIRKSTFSNSYSEVLPAESNTTVQDTQSTYELNSVAYSVFHISSSVVNFTNCIFCKNTAKASDMIYVKGGTLIFNACELANNIIDKPQYSTALLRTSENSTIKFSNSNIQHNSLSPGNKMLLIINSTLTVCNSTFAYHTAKETTSIILILNSKAVTCQNMTVLYNSARLSVIDIRTSEITFGKLVYANNNGSILVKDSKATFNEPSTFLSNKQGHPANSLLGSAIASITSTIHFKSTINFIGNNALKAGGAVSACESRIYAHTDILFANNTVNFFGGALFLDQSSFICQQKCIFTGNKATKGGAILAVNSIITIGNDWNKFDHKCNTNTILLSFVANSAKDSGGAIHLEANSKIRAPKGENCNYILELDKNTAQTGGAIFVNDYTSTVNCKGTNYFGTCFMQAPSFVSNQFKGWIKINSTIGKTTFYGGLLDRCITQRKRDNSRAIIGIDYLKNVTKNKNIEAMITSYPVRVCYCHNGNVSCELEYPVINTKKGKIFNVPVAAVDQVNHIIGATILIGSLIHYNVRFGIGQRAQNVPNKCSTLTLNISSPNDLVELLIFTKGPCKDEGISLRKLIIQFTPCICPIGFDQISKEDCVCDCDPQLKPFIITTCNQSSKSLLRQGDFWLNYTNNTDKIDYIIFPHCPYDYCVPSTQNVSINLNIPNGVDAQCALNRTGLLCSSCKSGHSISLGSSRCLSCPKDWPKLFIAIALGAIASGVVLVVIILALNLTVAVGTLNGLIFYANIMAANNITFCPLSKQNVFSVFIAWLNLELGLDTCFCKGLDMYSKVWLQLAFPTYLIAVLLTMTIISKYSSRFAKLIGKRNPIATLATLILLSYMKFLRNIIDIFSIADLRYPDGSQENRWLPDANIEYFKGRHIPLFLLATTIVFIGLLYTVLLLTWQWLLHAPNYKLLRWIRNTRLNLFMEANLAAYNSKHRYWTGLLLLIRVILYLEIAINTSDQTSNSLFTTGLISACLLFVKTLFGSSVYKKKLIDYLDSFCYLNLLILSGAQLYFHSNIRGRIIAAKVSLSAAFVQLLCVLMYHTVNTILEIPYLSRLKTLFAERLQSNSKLGEILPFTLQEPELAMQAMTTRVTPTSTEIGLSDSSEMSAVEDREEQVTSERVPQLLTAEWEETNSLREPLLQDDL